MAWKGSQFYKDKLKTQVFHAIWDMFKTDANCNFACFSENLMNTQLITARTIKYKYNNNRQFSEAFRVLFFENVYQFFLQNGRQSRYTLKSKLTDEQKTPDFLLLHSQRS